MVRSICGLCLSAAVLLYAGNAPAMKFPMPDIKGQFKKQNVKSAAKVTIQADSLSMSPQDNQAHAQGHVVVNTKDQHLYCDTLDMDRTIQQAVAEGNVYLETPQEIVVAQGLTYNFDDGTGEFRNARIFLDPYQVSGEKISKESENHMSMDEGYLTTCDFDEPHYRIGAHRMDIYMHDKAEMRGMKVYLGKMPIMYLPYFSQDLKNRQIFTFVPGENKDFGIFLLTTARFNMMGDHLKVALHADVRERTGFGEGFDTRYDTPNFGSGLVSAYYTDENLIARRHLWASTPEGTTHHERYRLIWRHKWQIDPDTNVVLQYYKIHDYDILNQGFLKTYFPKDYQQNAQNSDYDTYFVLTRNLPHGTLVFNVDTSRENRPIRGVERLPEVQYTLNNTQIGHSGFYVKSVDTMSNLSYQNYPKTFNEKTLRFDSNNDISHPFKLGFISFNPHVGGEETYYSRTAQYNENDVVRGLFRGSLDMTTKIYKVWDYHTNFAGLNINGLRHVITPTVTYLYQARPTYPAGRLNQFDSIDNLYRIHQFEFGLMNELQTKRSGEVVDLIRFLVTTNFGLKGTTINEPILNTLGGSPSSLSDSRRGFNPYDTQLDVNPTDWLSFHNDNEYDFHGGHLNTENFDVQLHQSNWAFAVGNRYTRGTGDVATTELDYIFNPKWKVKIYNTFPVSRPSAGNTESAKETEVVLTRDLHEWEMDMSIDRLQGHGTTFYVLFRLKAFPNMKFNLLSTNFQPSRPGSQNQ